MNVDDFVFFAATLKDGWVAADAQRTTTTPRTRNHLTLMKIVDSVIGRFPEIDRLNPRFTPGSLRLKLTVDTVEPPAHYLDHFPELLFRLSEMFPNLQRHDCSDGGEMHDFRDVEIIHPLLPIKIVGDVIDTVHLSEHLIIELQCSLTRMPMCSGVTCNLWEPENRYDVFVECAKPAMGHFTGRLGVQIINDVLRHGKMSSAPSRMVQIVPLLLQAPPSDARDIARQLRWSANLVQRTLEELRAYHFPFPD